MINRKLNNVRSEINNELCRKVSVAGLFRLPSINEERDIFVKRDSRMSSFRRDIGKNILKFKNFFLLIYHIIGFFIN